MANILVTGHDIGLGKVAYEQLLAAGHTVVGVCRTDWNLDSSDDREWLVNNFAHFDVLINNAYELDPEKLADPDRKIGQIELLNLFLQKWKDDSSKYIISHGSKISFVSPQKDKYIRRYALDKKKHAEVIDKWISNNPNGVNLCNFTIGWYAGAHEQLYIKQHEWLSDGVSKLENVDPTAYTEWLKLVIRNRNLVWPNMIIVDKSDRKATWSKYKSDSAKANTLQ